MARLLHRQISKAGILFSLLIFLFSTLANAADLVFFPSSSSYSHTISVAERTPPASPSSPSEISSEKLLPVITSASYPDAQKWYRTRDAVFSWELPQGVTAVRTLYNLQPDSVPSKMYEPAISSRSFEVDEDGVYYLHVQFRNGQGWGAVAHRKFQIDTRSPKNLSIKSIDGDITSNPNPSFEVTADDSFSGLDKVAFTIDNFSTTEFPVSKANIYSLAKLSPGKHEVKVTVFDKAGNTTESKFSLTVEKLEPPVITEYTRRGEAGNRISVSGTTYPNKKVEIVFTDENRNPLSETTTSDGEGNFEYVWPRRLNAGTYDLTLRVIDTNGSSSDFTEPRTVVIENIQLIRIGMFIMNWLSLVLIIILALMLIAATTWYSFLQFTRFRNKIHHAIKEAEETLKTNVAGLRQDTEDFHAILVKAGKKRELTNEEQKILKKFKKRLDIIETKIEKKLEQVG